MRSARSRERASAAALLAKGELVAARRVAARGREEALISMGYAAAGLIVAVLLIFVFANDGGVAQHLLRHRPTSSSRSTEVIHAFWTNIWVACVSEVLVLVLGLLVAIVRMLPGPRRARRCG